MGMEKILEQIKKLHLPEGTLREYKYGESVVIDDSYNSNPDGFLAALAVLDGYSDDYKKIVITRGMLELAEKSSQLHRKIGTEISHVAKELVIFSSSNEQDLRTAEKKINVVVKNSADELHDYIKGLKKQKAVVLIENRIPENIMNEIKK
jgi:UDP-N-acetylmuramoyl-tripeptide--D-alanyl-D-alanine ligase